VYIEFLYLSFNPLEEEILEELTGWAKENNGSLSCSIDSDGNCLETSVVLLTASLIFIKFI
jgi:hypothetical protein